MLASGEMEIEQSLDRVAALLGMRAWENRSSKENLFLLCLIIWVPAGIAHAMVRSLGPAFSGATASHSEMEMHAALEVNIPNYAAVVTTNEIVDSISSL